LYTEFIILFLKEKIFNVEDREKKLAEFKSDTAKLGNNYLELAEILRSLHPSFSLFQLNETLEYLKLKVDEIMKIDGN